MNVRLLHIYVKKTTSRITGQQWTWDPPMQKRKLKNGIASERIRCKLLPWKQALFIDELLLKSQKMYIIARSYKTCGSIVAEGIYVSARASLEFKSPSAYFQPAISTCSESMKLSLQAWIDDFTLYTITEFKLSEHLDELISIYGI